MINTYPDYQFPKDAVDDIACKYPKILKKLFDKGFINKSNAEYQFFKYCSIDIDMLVSLWNMLMNGSRRYYLFSNTLLHNENFTFEHIRKLTDSIPVLWNIDNIPPRMAESIKLSKEGITLIKNINYSEHEQLRRYQICRAIEVSWLINSKESILELLEFVILKTQY